MEGNGADLRSQGSGCTAGGGPVALEVKELSLIVTL